METQQSYKFLTDLGLAQYDATVRQYMEQTFAKKGETPSGSGVNVVEATIEPGEKEGDWKISEMSHTPDQIWDMLQTKQAVVIQGTVPEEGTIIFTPLEFVEYQKEKTGKDIAKTEVQGIQGIQGSTQEAQEAKSTNKVIIFTASYGPSVFLINIIYHKNDKTGEYQWDTECRIENIEIKPPYERINWQDLKDLRDNGNLEPGKQYCIVDYEFTCTQAGVGPAAHYFGIIVTADDYDKLNENARAIYIGDSYFQNCNLSAWELKYCLDNDKDRFQWAQWGKMSFDTADRRYVYKLVRKENAYWKWKFTDEKFENYTYVYTIPNPSTNDHIYDTYDFNELTKYLPATINNIEGEGKGVIYWMRDEWGNECPYDFKNAMFRTPGYFGNKLEKDMYYYTFSSDSGISLYDKSTLPKQAINNIIKDYRGVIPVNIFLGSHSNEQVFTLTANNELGQNCTNNIFGENCYGNRFGNNCTDNSFGDYVRDNVAVAYLQNCWIGDQSWGNKFGTNCVGIRAPQFIKFIGNTFGDDVNGMDFSKVGIKPKKDQCITNTIVYSGTQGLPTFKLDYSNDIPKFIGITQKGAIICVQGIDGFGGSSTGDSRPATFMTEEYEMDSDNPTNPRYFQNKSIITGDDQVKKDDLIYSQRVTKKGELYLDIYRVDSLSVDQVYGICYGSILIRLPQTDTPESHWNLTWSGSDWKLDNTYGVKPTENAIVYITSDFDKNAEFILRAIKINSKDGQSRIIFGYYDAMEDKYIRVVFEYESGNVLNIAQNIFDEPEPTTTVTVTIDNKGVQLDPSKTYYEHGFDKLYTKYSYDESGGHTADEYMIDTAEIYPNDGDTYWTYCEPK